MKKNKGGRPPEGRVKVTWYIKPDTLVRARAMKQVLGVNTMGKVIDKMIGK